MHNVTVGAGDGVGPDHDRGMTAEQVRGGPGPAVPSNVDGDDLVVLVDESGTPCGTAPKAQVHNRHTPLHLAFSCWVSDPDGRILITRRALDKATWPGVWSNAFCGHPRPGEALSAAVGRRARDELGVAVDELRLALPEFRYRAVMANGVVENEICPVFLARLREDPEPAAQEVADFRWTDVRELRLRIESDPHWFSPWAVRQLSQLAVVSTSFRTADADPEGRRGVRVTPLKTYRNLLGHRPRSPSARTDSGAVQQ